MCRLYRNVSMFHNVNNVSFGKNESQETQKSFFRKTNEIPNDSVELSSVKPKSLAGKLTRKIFEKVAKQKEVIEQKRKVSPMQMYQNMIKDGITNSRAKKITGDSTLLNRYILFTSSEKDEDGNLISGLKKPLKADTAAALISAGLDETQIKKSEILLDFRIPTYKIPELINNELFMTLISDEVDENGELLSGLPKVLSYQDVDTLKDYSEDEIKQFRNLVSIKKDETGKLLSGLTRPFTFNEAMDFIKNAASSASSQLYIDLLDNGLYSFEADEIIADENLQQRLYMLCGDEKAKQASPFSEKFEFSEAIQLIQRELTNEQIETYIRIPKEKDDNGICYYGRYPIVDLIKNGFKENESFQMFTALDSDYHYRDYIRNYYPVITNPETVKLFSLLTNPEKDEKTGKYISGCKRELNHEEATKLCISLKYPDVQLPKCIQLINLGVSVDDAICMVAHHNEEEKDRFSDFLSFISDEKDENGQLKSGLSEPLSVEQATYIVSKGIPYEHIPLFIEMTNDGLLGHKIEYFLKKENSCTRYKELRTDIKYKDYSLSPSETYAIVENKIEDSQIARFIELTKEKSALALGLKRGLTPEEASSVVKEDIKTEQIPLFLEILSDEKDENGNLKSGLKERIESPKDLSHLIKQGYSKEQIIRFSEVYLHPFGLKDFRLIQFNQAEEIIKYNLSDEEVERYLRFCKDSCFDTQRSIYDLKTKEEREKFKISVFNIVKDTEKFERYKNLTDSKILCPLVAVRFVDPEICSDNQIEFYKQLELLYRNADNPFVTIDCAKNKDNYEKYCRYTTNFELDDNGERRPLTNEEAVHVIYNAVSEENIPKYIKLLNENKNFNPSNIASLVKRNIFSSEQIKLYQEMIKYSFWNQESNEEQVVDILSSPEKIERYKLITSSELDKNSLLLNSVNQTLKRNDNARLKSGLKRALKSEEAIDFLSPKIIDNKRINEYIDIVDAGVYSKEARNLFINDENYDKYSVLISKDKNLNGTLKSGLKRPLNPKEAIDVIENNLDISQIKIYIDLVNSSIRNNDAIEFVKNTEYLEQYNVLTSTEKDTNGVLKSGLKRPLKVIEVYEAINNKLDLQQTKLLVELVDENIPIRDAISVLTDEKKYQKLLHYSSKEVDEIGNLKNKLPRPLTLLEAYKVSDKKLNTSQISKYINLRKNNISVDTAIILAKDFSFLEHKNNINELSLKEKRRFLKSLISNNYILFQLDIPSGGFQLIPLNQKEYCKTLDKLAKSIGIDTRELNSEQKSACYDGLKEIADVLMYSNIDNCEIYLDFSREKFLQEIQSILSKLNISEQRKVMDYFGFEIKNGKLSGYPINVNNGEKLKEIENDETKAVVEELRPIVQRFSVDNKINIPQDKKLEKTLNKILEGLPELKTLVGKTQHKTQDYSLDKHTLKVLQNVVKNPNYESLSDADKRIITIAALLHDIAKTEGVIDKVHPVESAFDAFYIIQKFNLPEDEQLKLYQLIKTHDWLEKLNNPQENSDKLSKDIAFNMRHSNTFELSKILCEADLKSVKADESFWTNFQDAFVQKSKNIQNYLDILEKSRIFLPQTKIPKASEMQNVETKTANGITNKVLYINQCDNDLSKYGFEQGTTVENWKGLVHALDYETQLRNCDTFSIIDSDALLSTSYMNPKEYHVFRKQGLILDVHSSDIHAGYYRDFGSGYTKNLELLQNDYLFGGSREKYRNYIPNLIKEKLKLTDEKYVELMKKIEGCKSITDIEKIDSEFASVLQNVFEEMDSGKRSYGRKYNEILSSRPKIQGVFSYEQDYEDIPLFLRKYAQDNDLTIIMF